MDENGERRVMLFGVNIAAKRAKVNDSVNDSFNTEDDNQNEMEICSFDKPEDESDDEKNENPDSGQSSNQENRKKVKQWTKNEHKAFLVGLQTAGRGKWKDISRNYVKTKTSTQVASHAQKIMKIQKLRVLLLRGNHPPATLFRVFICRAFLRSQEYTKLNMCKVKEVIIRQVWTYNLEYEVNLIHQAIHQHPMVSIDTEFSGVIHSPKIDRHYVQPSNNYYYLKENVDALKLIQFGPTLTDFKKNLPDFGSNNNYI
ncbi:uncharacterized protein LOC127131362 [Lathyrus oleraceus]|uniref:uncharacterized protein LOC127131362 n=1 Tax=Pisum sativum TaxID=3888 RepID=UPI0021CE8A99|nr:uncharacterized protein LOC127131362 [Pisum sativum]